MGIGYGQSLGTQTAAGPPAVYTNILNSRDIKGPGLAADQKDRTVNDSSGRRKRKESGLKEVKECTISYLYKKTVYNALLALVGVDGTIWRLTYPDGSTFDFTGALSDLEPNSPMAEEQELSATVTPDGDVYTFTPAA